MMHFEKNVLVDKKKKWKTIKSVTSSRNLSEFQSALRRMPKTQSGRYDFRYATFENLELHDCDFSDANFEGAIFENVTFKRCRFAQAIFLDAYFKGANFFACDFSYANVTNADFVGGSLIETSFFKAETMRLSFSNTYIDDVNTFLDRGVLSSFKNASYKNIDKINQIRSLLKDMINSFYYLIIMVISLMYPKRYRGFGHLDSPGKFRHAELFYKNLQSQFDRNSNKINSLACQHFAFRSHLLNQQTSYWNKLTGLLIYGLGNLVTIRLFLIVSFSVIFYFGYHYSNNENYITSSTSDLEFCSSETTIGSSLCIFKDGQPIARKLTFIEGVYFAGVTFVTLGYGDLSPELNNPNDSLWNRICLLWPVIEAFIGAMLIAGLIGVIIRIENAR